MAAANGSLDQARVDAGNRIEQSDVRRAVDHTKPGRGQHHRYLSGVRQRREDLGMARIQVSTRAQGFLVDRRRADRVDLAGSAIDTARSM